MKKIIYLIIGVLLLFLALGGILVVIEDKPKDAWIDVLMIIVFSTFALICFIKSYKLYKIQPNKEIKKHISENVTTKKTKPPIAPKSKLKKGTYRRLFLNKPVKKEEHLIYEAFNRDINPNYTYNVKYKLVKAKYNNLTLRKPFKDIEALVVENDSNELEQPISKPLDLNYTKARTLTYSFVVLDFETTGLKYDENEIIQYGIAEFKDGHLIKEKTQFFKPNKPISKRITKITGITNEFLGDKPPLNRKLLEELNTYISNKTIVAHNASFDMKFLLYNFHKYNVNHNKFRVIDTLKFSRKYINETPNHKLVTLKEHFNLDDGVSHDALNDCKATGNLMMILNQRANV